MMKSVLALLVTLSLAHAFVVVPATQHCHHTLMKMSDGPMDSNAMGETERLLMQRREHIDSGMVQEMGRTIKKDGLDGVRALVWAMFDVSNYVFPAMGAVLSFGLLLNMAGYGYFFDDGSLVFDTLQNIQQEAFFQEEVAKLTVDVVEKASML